MNDPGVKQQITERIKNATNILVTVSTNPTVDELSAALGLTLMLNKFDKHATAVFSGKIPPAITFLEPNKTFENTVDSLRDFIIALDKDKADRLRYRVEDDMVRIFITPYRTRITEEDLEFTHGDFNVELVLALGVANKDVLDAAITAHGRILHDATVVTINAQNKTSELGSIAWQDPNASSLCEMLVSISEALSKDLLDEQIATALLTGIVAATNRFSNRQTSPKSLTMAAQLMAAGANQQLIAAKLGESAAISPESAAPAPDGSVKLTEGNSEKIREEPADQPEKEGPSLGEMTISHEDEPEAGILPKKPPYVPSATIEQHDVRNKKVAGEEALDAALTKLGANDAKTAQPNLNDELEQAASPPSPPAAESPPQKSWREQALLEPSMGGQLSATTQEAEDDKRSEEQSNLNKVILNHGPAAPPKGKTIMPPLDYEEAPIPTFAAEDTLAEIEDSLSKQHDVAPALPAVPSVDTARSDVHSLFSAPSGLLPSTPSEISPTAAPVQSAASDLPPLPPPPPLPDFSALPPLPPSSPTASPPVDISGLALPGSPAAPQTPPAPAPNTPGQFKIPGQ